MKEKIKVTKESLIKDISKQTNNSTQDVKDIYNALENIIFEKLSSANVNQDICIKLFEGVSFESTYIPEKTKQINLTGETVLVKSKIKPKCNITRYYCEKLNI